MSKIKILIIGDIILDRYSECNICDTESDDKKIINYSKIYDFLGGAANVAYNICSLGANAYLSGCVGKDESSKIIKCLANNINLKLLKVKKNHCTILKNRIILNNNIEFRIDNDNFGKLNNFEFDRNYIRLVRYVIKKVDGIIVSNYNKGFLSEDNLNIILNLCKKYNKKFYIDSKFINLNQLDGCELYTPTLSEFNKNFKFSYTSIYEIEKNTLHMLCETNHFKNIIVKNNSEGNIFYIHDKNELLSYKKKVFKKCSIGAGDVFIASFVYKYFEQYNYGIAYEFANKMTLKSIEHNFTSIIRKDKNEHIL